MLSVRASRGWPTSSSGPCAATAPRPLLNSTRSTGEPSASWSPSLLGAAAPDELVADVASRTDGVPLLVEEVVDAHVRAGSVEVDAGQARWRGGAALVPRSVRGMVEARLEPLPGVLQDVLVAGAVLGRFEPAQLLTAVSQSDRETVRRSPFPWGGHRLCW